MRMRLVECVLLVMLLSSLAHAHPAHSTRAAKVHREALVKPADLTPVGTIQIIEPVEDVVLNEAEVKITVSFAEISTGSLSALDHIHYIVAPIDIEYDDRINRTMPDLTGRVDLLLDPDAPNGRYENCVYLANVNHDKLSSVVCKEFILAKSGLRLFYPKSAGVYTSSSVPLEFELFGNEVTNVKYQLDQGAAQTLVAEDSSITIDGVSNGEHKIKIWAEEAGAAVLGKETEFSFIVASALTTANAKKTKNLIKRCLDEPEDDSRFIKKALKLASNMQAGGKVAADNSKLTNTEVAKLVRLLKKAQNGTNKSANLTKAQRLLTRLLKVD